MSIQVKYPFDDQANYIHDVSKIELVGGEAKLIPQLIGATAELYAKLDDNAGLVALDSSGNDRHGAFQGGFTEAQWTTGKINSAVKGLSTSNGIINFDQLLAFERTDAFTLECWVKFTSTVSQGVISKQKSTGNLEGFSVFLAAGKARITVRDSAGNILSVETVDTYNDNVFHHIVATYDGSSDISGLRVYADNVLNQSIIVSDALTDTITNDADLQVSGRDGNTKCLLATTTVDEVVIYSRELTAADVAFRWNLGYGTQEIPGASTLFPTDNPTIKSVSTTSLDSLDSFAATVTEPGADEVRFTLLLNGQSTYWDGAEWADSDNSLSQTNTAAEIQSNLGDLTLSEDTSFKPVAFLHSDNGTTTPALDDITISFTQEALSAVAPNECLVFGFVYDNSGSPVENVTVSAALIRLGEYKDELVISKNVAVSVTDSSGYWEISLVENESMQADMGYRFNFSSSYTNEEFDKVVPDEVTKNFLELADL